MRRLLLLPLLFLLATAAAQAQHKTVWGTSSAEGEYIVNLDEIVSVSSHSYVVDGAAKVTEVNIGTKSPLLVRYYYIDIITPETPSGVGKSVINKVTEIAKEAAGRTVPSEIKVVKNYPTTTHAGTVEYRTGSLDTLTRIYNSAKQAFLYRKGEILKLE